MNPPATVLVTRATGYIGGRQAPRLLDDGHRVRVLARSAARVRWRSWAEQVEVVEGDALGVSGPLIDGLRNEVVVTDSLARELFPAISPRDYAGAIAKVIEDLEQGRVETAWSDAHGGSDTPDSFSRVESHEGMIFERRTRQVAAPAREVYRVFTGIGGDRGWFHGDWMWRIRGMVDRLLGGAGLRRGRRHPDELRVGDALDFWRVEVLEPDRLVRLRAEMKLPGRAWLQFRVWETEAGTTRLEQTAAFLPKGLGGLLYWYGLYPVHARIFDGLAREITRRAEARSSI